VDEAWWEVDARIKPGEARGRVHVFGSTARMHSASEALLLKL
jgi:hypothetical protein